VQTHLDEWSVGPRQTRGWVRRLAPERWQYGVVAGSREASEQGSWLSLLAAIGRSRFISWLTTIDQSLIAENKHYQLAVASGIGVAVPRAVVSNRTLDVLDFLPHERIVKTLGPGHYVEGGESRVIFTQAIDDATTALLEGDIPMIYQEELRALQHLRVVVVGVEVWVCALDAADLPLDWRSEPVAHESFATVPTSDHIRGNALSVCKALGIGYSSQDWVVTAAGPVLVDVNPGGQWLFLPEPAQTEISIAIAKWLRGTNV